MKNVRTGRSGEGLRNVVFSGNGTAVHYKYNLTAAMIGWNWTAKEWIYHSQSWAGEEFLPSLMNDYWPMVDSVGRMVIAFRCVHTGGPTRLQQKVPGQWSHSPG